uniref:Ion transport domain-containing protein n=1 Tax=Caenorhabditis japonica TaxID=281687 RepID=A0A8R1E529_CAEJA
MLYTIVSEGKFEIFGEVQDKDREGTLRNCEEFNRTILDFFDMHYAEASCLFRSSIMPFLVFAYMFVAGILLINLLTAQLTKEYEKESENSQYYKGYLEYEQLSKIESKLFLPPPLSLVYIFIRLLSYCSNWMLVNVVERMEGYPWGSVRDSTCDDSVEELIKQYLSRGPETVFRELKDVISKYGREGVNAQKLEQLQNNLNAILDAAVLEDARATLARSRACTRADYDDPSVEWGAFARLRPLFKSWTP